MTHTASPTLLATPDADANLALVRRFLDTMENGGDGDAIAAFFTADAIAVEYPTASPIPLPIGTSPPCASPGNADDTSVLGSTMSCTLQSRWGIW